ncbi:hypothetical protein SAMN05443144_11473 [Fodinibius roseus]|uniref:Uncharacterized protein n=1 Tax=Fodinibius roseus TaxID=1194090 RepID=A0A1M5F613_9BACT|nr:hypothetical protein [Fodinibius roseus]SHF86949.1 hypothetical protein SAMN05443144_11473 [Fodinibius roseus]
MDIQTADNKFQSVKFGDSSFEELKNELARTADHEQHHLSLFLGLYEPHKQKALNEIAAKLDREVETIRTDKLVSTIESETFDNLDTLFSGLSQSDVILYFKNGGKLCGTYTGYSHSRVKYATPQERYFLKKVKQFNGLVIVDIEEFTDADMTLRRAAQSVVSFFLPGSRWQRFIWHLKNYSFHGVELKTKRPEAYGEAS